MIGVTGHRRYGYEVQSLPSFVAHEPMDIYMSPYARSIAEAGGAPVLLTREADPTAVVERLDGLLLAGGEDVDPIRYGAAAPPEAGLIDPGRDELEFALYEAAVSRGIPVLGVCRGLQLINVACGGTLIVDIPHDSGEAHGFRGYPGAHRRHAVDITEGSDLYRLLGSSVNVNSYHHQAVDEPGAGVVVTARAGDGIVEAIELPDRRVLAVQWHPEMFGGDPVFDWLIEQARLPLGEKPEVEDDAFRAVCS
ncbi:gamma-glutamyl-gamma-aminobutyrate hydrolase family protein [Streptomyces tuirus]|uniref:Gamma-glutamyl-gamma-aminobutyrate hydrolase family protein n=1 Tax=Streptomyces tuirus TaxID=68278 RepID=A0A941FA89_9ACTN|nr:gamma-glutamyl-gamma-aminobutyrate hydrolase family protein [Streptomyces tuirus]